MKLAVIAVFAAFGLIVLGVIGFLAFDTVIAYDVSCTRSADACTLEQRRLTNTTQTTIPLHSLKSATVVLARGGRGQGSRVFLMLVGDGDRSFAAEYEGLSAQEDAAAAGRVVDAVLADSSRQELKLEVTNPLLYPAAWIGGVCAFCW
ncbi:MAG TPA: hypothetical protein VMU79_02485 [Casimicrobiaceae bacterium]|jgi:hypothetical protein|nr:hypothetical protein [Casimicrobiaceae bacterium]